MLKDLVDDTMEDGMHICTWMDDDYIFTTIGFITFSLDKEDFRDFVRCLNKTSSQLIKLGNENEK